MAWFRKEHAPLPANEQESRVPRASTSSARLQGDHLPQGGGVQPGGLPELRLPLPHLRPRAAVAAVRRAVGGVRPDLVTSDPLKFKDTKPYADRLVDSKAKTDSYDALVSAVGTMGGLPTVMAVMEYGFIGGSMGVVVGEKVTRAVERAIARAAARCSIVSLLRRRAHDGRHALADADGQDLRAPWRAWTTRGCPSSRS